VTEPLAGFKLAYNHGLVHFALFLSVPFSMWYFDDYRCAGKEDEQFLLFLCIVHGVTCILAIGTIYCNKHE